MIKIKETIVVEGVYDKIRLESIVDAIVLVTNGFAIFKDAEKLAFLRQMADKTGIIVLTDSDAAGFAIRNFVKQGIAKEKIKHAYIPDIFGKEKRKTAPSKEGKLGVEGVDGALLADTLRKAGATIIGEAPPLPAPENPITRMDLYNDGFTGGAGSANKRRKLLTALGLPQRMSTNLLCEVINHVTDMENYKRITENIKAEG